jgi:hypothetical protein
MCNKAGAQVTDANEELFRHVGPDWLVEDGEPSSQAFLPFRDVDDGCLSVDRSSVTTAAASFALFTGAQPAGFGRPASSVWAVTVGEAAALALSTWEDPTAATGTTPPNPAHGVVEFGPKNNSWRKNARALKVLAIARGQRHP